MKKWLFALASLAPLVAFAQTEGTDKTPEAITQLYRDAASTITANVPLITTVLTAAFGIAIAFVVYRLIKKATGRAG